MTPAEQYIRRASHLAGIVLGATALLLTTSTAIALLIWLARATWRAALA